MEDQLQESWDRQNETARMYDDREVPWSPPNFSALVTAARATTLRRLYPFTSHWVLRFRANEDMPGKLLDIAPASIALSPGGIYQVQSGRKWADPATVVLETGDPVKAVTALEQLLMPWDWQGHEPQLEY